MQFEESHLYNQDWDASLFNKKTDLNWNEENLQNSFPHNKYSGTKTSCCIDVSWWFSKFCSKCKELCTDQ